MAAVEAAVEAPMKRVAVPTRILSLLAAAALRPKMLCPMMCICDACSKRAGGKKR